MKLEDLFKRYFADDEIHAGDPDYEEENEEDEEDESSSSSSDDDDENDEELDEDQDQDQEEQQEDQDNDRKRDRDKEKDDKKDKDDSGDKSSEENGKEGDQSTSDKGEETGKNDAAKEQEAKEKGDKNIGDKDAEGKKGEGEGKEAKGSEGKGSSDTGAKGPEDGGASKAGEGAKDAGQAGEEAAKGMGGGAEKGAEAGAQGAAGQGGAAGAEGAAGTGATGTGAVGTGAGAEGAAATGAAGTEAAAATGAAGTEAAAATGAAGVETAAGTGAVTSAAATGATTVGGTAAAGTGAAGGTAAGAAGGTGIGAAITATLPWSLIVIAVIIIIIIIIIVVSFFQTLPGSMLENLKTSVKKWFSNLLANVAETFLFEDNTLRVNEDDVNRLAQYVNDMGYDIQTYGFGDIIVTKDSEGNIDYEPNRVDKTVQDDGETDELKVKSKYLKAYLAADECTYHFRKFNIAKVFFDSSTDQQGLIHCYYDGGGIWNGADDKLELDRESECLRLYNHSLEIPVIDFFKNIFTGSPSFKWGEMVSYDLNTWIGRYKRPVELFLAIHLSTMMPDLTYRIATESRFNTEVNVHFEPIKICLRGTLTKDQDTDAYIKVGGTKYKAREIVENYLNLFEIKKGLFQSESDAKADEEEWLAFVYNTGSAQQLWDAFTDLFEKFDDVESFLQDAWNWLVNWKYIHIENSSQVLKQSVFGFDPDINIESKYNLPGFYGKFGCTYTTLASSSTYDGDAEDFALSDMNDMVDEWNEDADEDHQLGQFGSDYYIRTGDEWYKMKLKDGTDTEYAQKIVTLAYLVYKFGTEDIMPGDDGWGEGDQGGLDNMQWPFVRSVKNHWYYKDIDFLGTTEEDATYRLAKVGYKTIFYSSDDRETFEMPCALYPNQAEDWDFLVYQVAEPTVSGPNDYIKEVFSGEYYRYDGTVQKAKMIANSRAKEDGKSQYYYNGEECDVQDCDVVPKEAVSMADSPEQTLQSLAILKNMHSVASDYIYRDLKELYVNLEYYSREQMTEALKLMMLWPIEVDNKNEPFDMIETKKEFGKAIIPSKGRNVLAPMDGTMSVDNGTVVIKVGKLNDDAWKLLKFIYRNDFYSVDQDLLKDMGLEIRLTGVTLTTNKTSVTRGEKIGTVPSDGQLSVTILQDDKTVVENLAEYMREDHNNKYEEIMKRKMECEEGSLPPIPLRDLFGDDDWDDDVSVSGDDYDNTPEPVSATEAAMALYEALKDNFSDEQIAAALGNVQYESGCITNNLQNSYEEAWNTTDAAYTSAVNAGGHPVAGKDFVHDAGGYGMAQWTFYSRKQKLWNKATNLANTDVSNLGIQVELLREEMVDGSGWGNISYKPSFDSCGSGENGVKVATIAYCKGFESPEDPEASMQTRIGYALGYYELIKDGTLSGTSTARGGSAGDGVSSVAGGTIVWPAPNTTKGSNSSGFGRRINPVNHNTEYHHGEDIPGSTGDPIVSASNGVICGSGWTDARGYYVLVYDESTGTKFVYQHMNSSSPLSVGTKVSAGDKIGEIGSTGMSTGPHLHFEVHLNDSNSDYIPWKSGGLADGTVDPKSYNYVSST